MLSGPYYQEIKQRTKRLNAYKDFVMNQNETTQESVFSFFKTSLHSFSKVIWSHVHYY